jgi:hypothetical protein
MHARDLQTNEMRPDVLLWRQPCRLLCRASLGSPLPVNRVMDRKRDACHHSRSCGEGLNFARSVEAIFFSTVRTDAALLRFFDEGEELPSEWTKIRVRGGFNGLRKIQRAEIEQFESGFDVFPFRGIKSGASYPDDVQSEDGITLCRKSERRKVFSERRTPLDHDQTTDSHVLMKG